MSSRARVCFSIQPAALSAYRPGRVEPITMAMRGFVVMITSYFDFGQAFAVRVDGSAPGARGPRQRLRVDVLPDVRHLAVSNGNGEDPVVIERLTVSYTHL